ncbi:DUF1642 domain-containing protein [Enterococcus thailandicus]|uniref:DUF1642 domain-containing protein n=1 Tax=Enterococcus thailandicus TaxID=417368 RepID=UPI0022EBB30F|nr:DUF1642 domain-containing protein [Enterococcus thailandicus]MDA3973272.1 DUF1642 domain-containing protein [Enterococcus thailandicus]MDA3976142.1 DUF1642 domain-containing protein [Enterococcus thailandicus]MDA3980732.1 DUF1642 domain-containing protein [Enterococcus thailandicus]
MNKQELIERLHEAGGCGADSETWARGYDDGISVAIDIVEQLDEPQKPDIPTELAEYIKENDGENVADVFSQEWLIYYDNQPLGEKVGKWIFDNDEKENNRRYLIAVQAFVTGDYEVEKEPLYVMPVPHVSFPVHYCVEDDHVSFRQGNAQKFTQAELDKYFPDIKQFAVPVDEVEEG